MSDTTNKMLGRYVSLNIDGLVVDVKLDDEGIVVDAWQDGEVIASTYELYSEMGVQVKEIDDDCLAAEMDSSDIEMLQEQLRKFSPPQENNDEPRKN